MRQKGRRRSADKTAAILAGALQEFPRQGYAATSMDRIAAVAGVSKATVYGHFHDKRTLFQSLSRQIVEERLHALFGASGYPGGNGTRRDALKALAHQMLQVETSQPDFLPFLRLVIGESGRFPHLARDFAGQFEGLALPRLVELFRSPGEAPPPCDPETAARIFVGALAHLILTQDLLHGREVKAVDRGPFVEALLDLLCPAPAPRG